MSILPDPPSAGALNALSDNATLHADAAWLSVKKLFPIEMEADRTCAVGLAIAFQATCAFPVPLVADETANQSAFEPACHVQAVVKLKVPEPPVDATVPDAGLI